MKYIFQVKIEKGAFVDYKWVNEKKVKQYESIKGVPEEVETTIRIFKNS